MVALSRFVQKVVKGNTDPYMYYDVEGDFMRGQELFLEDQTKCGGRAFELIVIHGLWIIIPC
jgi:hypothetical protein